MKVLAPLALSLLVGLSACAGRKKEPPKPRPRPVKVFKLAEQMPAQPLSVTGAVAAWKEQDMSFEVDGQVTMMQLEGAYLDGQWKVGDDVVEQGDVLARVDPEPYEIARDTAQANLAVAQRDLEVAQVELEKVYPARVKAAEAARDRAIAEYERKEQAVETNAISRLEFIYATAERDAQLANVEETLAAVEQQKAKIESLKAVVKQSQEQLRQAEYDLERCTLYAKITGQVSDLYVEAGGYTRRGQAVAHLVMMDPMKVDVAVSADTAREMGLGDSVHLLLPGETEPTSGQVIEKATVADPDTRTFRVSVMARNWQSIPSVPQGDPRLKLPRIEKFQFLQRERYQDAEGPFVVEEQRALRKDADGHFIWVAEGLNRDMGVSAGTAVTARKVRVAPGEDRFNRQGLFTFVALADAEELKGGEIVLWDVPDETKDGDQLLVAQEQWRLRPGQTVRVMLSRDLPARGFYAPMNAILRGEGSDGALFIVADGTAQRANVHLRNQVGEMIRVEPISEEDGKLLVEGAEVILDYIHFLRDDDEVRVTRTVEVRQ